MQLIERMAALYLGFRSWFFLIELLIEFIIKGDPLVEVKLICLIAKTLYFPRGI